MDLKFLSIAWVGKNISQKFETMFQEVDNIVSKDTVNYVGNQMQTVGESMKKFCSDVVQVLPPLTDPVKHEAQEVVLKNNAAIGTDIKSMIDIEKNSVDTVIKQSHFDPNHIPISLDSFEGEKSGLSSRKSDNVLTHEISDASLEENAMKNRSPASELSEVMSLSEKDPFETSFLYESGDNDLENECGVVAEASSVTSFHVVECQSSQKVDTVCDNFADDSVSVSDASNSFATSEMAFSAVSHEEKSSETGSVDVGISQLKESKSLQENSTENLRTKTVIHNDPVDGVGCVSDSSDALSFSTSSPIVYCKDKAGKVGLINSSSDLSLHSTEEDAPGTNHTVSLTEMSQNSDPELCGSANFEVLTTASNTGPSHDYSDDFNYTGMETIELFDKVKLNDSCVMVDSKDLYAVSCRTRKLRSFKKRIQDAFASKKRLAKEYEQLAIWFGDVDIEPSEDALQSLLSSTTSITLDSKDLSTDHNCDSEWELL